MKTCFKCGRRLESEQFYRHRRMGDGRLGKCKDCTKHDVRTRYWEKHEDRLAYDRRRSKSVKRRAAIAKYQQRNPEKLRAQIHVHNAVKRGKLTRKPCEVCGDSRTDAHHDDYSKPLAVRWLCRMHHRQHHVTMAEQMENAS